MSKNWLRSNRLSSKEIWLEVDEAFMRESKHVPNDLDASCTLGNRVVFLVDTAYFDRMSAEILLRTGEAARRLGVSRQHIVDLCDQGALPSVMVGSHRRIPEGAVTAKLASVSGRALVAGGSEQSLWLHAALIPRLLKDPDAVVGKARANLAQGRASGAIDVHSEPYAREWEAILDGGVGCTIAALLDPCEHAATLRSSSPFAGILPQDEVRAIKEAWRQRRLAGLAR
ncbi:excisionase family DNA-binding protein [Mycobacterium gordonae]|nr:excisionase family DNA-binding protein [Mycobacterium gordonae]MCV7005127.1 excisionase family DNA-binding protein [Mycobacterium gordonae]